MTKIDPKISKECVSYCKIPTQDKKRGTFPKNPTAGPQTIYTSGDQTYKVLQILYNKLKGNTIVWFLGHMPCISKSDFVENFLA